VKRKRARAAKGSALGRVLEILADLALILVILAFGVSIAARYNPEKKADVREVRPGHAPYGAGAEARPEGASPLPDPVRRPSGRGETGEQGAHPAGRVGGAGGRMSDDGTPVSAAPAAAPARGPGPATSSPSTSATVAAGSAWPRT